MADEKPDTRAWGYSKDEPEGRIFDDGKLPKGYYPNPAMVPGSEAEERYKADAEREGASIPWATEEPKASDKPTLTLPADKAK